MTTAEKFEQAQERVKQLTKRPSNEQLLALYSLYKQGTQGDVTGKRPGMLDIQGRAKYDAWSKRAGMDPEKAQQEYVDLVDTLLAELG